MKKFLTLCVAALATVACGKPQSSTEVSQIQFSDGLISNEVRGIIGTELAKRCEEVFMRDEILNQRCGSAMQDLGQDLGFNYKSKDGGSAFTFFAPELERLMGGEWGPKFLDAFIEAVELGQITGAKVNAFDFAMAYTGNNLKQATEALAVLFQDDINTKAQVRYLRFVGNPHSQKLEDALALIADAEAAGTLAMYPARVRGVVGRGFYHYYVPSYLAMRLREEGHEADMAYLAPFMFNAIYELRQIYEAVHPESRATGDGGNQSRHRDLINHLNGPMIPFDPNQYQDGLKDMWLGYAGAIVGAAGDLGAWYNDIRSFGLMMGRDPKVMFFIYQTAVPRQ